MVRKVAAPKVVDLFSGKAGKPEINEAYVSELWKGIYNVPALITRADFWNLHQKEADSLAGPTTRIINRMSPAEIELFSRFADPVALVMTALAITLPRIEMTRAFYQELKIQRETEARREALGRSVAASPDDVRRRVDGEAAAGTPVADAAGDVPGGGQFVQDAFGEGRW